MAITVTGYPVHCGYCDKLLGVATHIVNSVYCNEDCAAARAQAALRKIKDDPRA